MADRAAPWENDPLAVDVGGAPSPRPDRSAQAPWMNDPEEPQAPWWQRAASTAGSAVASGAQAAYEAAFPERDPETAHIPGFSSEGIRSLEDRSRINRSMFTSAGFEDKPWRRIVLETLGDRVTNLRTDNRGNEIVTYRGDDGKTYERYINRPGLDLTDVERGIHGAVPYMIGAGAAARLGGGVARRMAQQGVTAGAISAGQDVAAGEDVDPGKAAWTGVFGAAGEAAGTLAPKIIRMFYQRRMWDETAGTLTPAGRRQAQRLGLDPDQVQAHIGRRINEIRRTEDPRAALAGIETGEHGIPTTIGQRTKDPELLNIEEQMRRSLFGPGAREVISEFDTQQRQAMQRAAEAARARVAPQGGATAADAGQGITEGLRAAQTASRQRVADAWAEVGELYPVLSETATGDTARGLLSTALRQHIDDLGFFPDQQVTPMAHRMMQAVDDYAKGLPERAPYEILRQTGQTPRVPALDAMRRRLLKQYQSAGTPQDRAAARAIYNAFTDWTEQAATRHGILRNPGGRFEPRTAAQPMHDARRITRRERALFEPRTTEGRLTPSGRILTDLAENADTPERVADVLFGAGVTTAPKAGTVNAIRRLRTALPAARFDQVKAAYFLKMVTGKDGNLLSPGRLNTAMNQAFERQGSVLSALFTAEERRFLQDFRRAINTAAYTPPNPSGTSYALEAMRRKRRSALEYVFRRLGTRATFQGRVWQGTMYHWLARVVPNIFNMQEAASRSMARGAIRQALDFRPDSGELMSSIAAAYQASQGEDSDGRGR